MNNGTKNRECVPLRHVQYALPPESLWRKSILAAATVRAAASTFCKRQKNKNLQKQRELFVRPEVSEKNTLKIECIDCEVIVILRRVSAYRCLKSQHLSDQSQRPFPAALPRMPLRKMPANRQFWRDCA